MSKRAKHRYSWGGSTLLHELRVNPTVKEIDSCYRQFRVDLETALTYDDIEKNGKYYNSITGNEDACFCYLPPSHIKFTLADVTESKRVMKRHRNDFTAIKDWNDLPALMNLLKRLKVPRATLNAHLIFAAWKHNNINLIGGDGEDQSI